MEEQQHQHAAAKVDRPSAALAAYTVGTPQSAEMEATGNPPAGPPVKLGIIRKGNAIKQKGGCGYEAPGDYGGDILLKPSTARTVEHAGSKVTEDLRKIAWIRDYMAANNDKLPVYAAYEINRVKAIAAIKKWIHPRGLELDGEVFYPGNMTILELRTFVGTYIMPPLDMSKFRSDEEEQDESEMDWAFFFRLHEMVQSISNLSAIEVAAVGEPYIVGRTRA